MQTKEQILADSVRKNLFAGVSFKLFDRKVRLYGDVAIINGRSQFLIEDKILGEVYYTEIWLKEKGSGCLMAGRERILKEHRQL
jgi:hypothetical protein